MTHDSRVSTPVAVYVHSPEGMVKLDESATALAEHGWVTVQAYRAALDEARRGPACAHVFDDDRCVKCGGIA